MKRGSIAIVVALILGFDPSNGIPAARADGAPPRVNFHTNLGDIQVELDAEHAPITTENFLAYVRSGYYNGTLFHRVLSGFVIQGGGFTSGLVAKSPRAPIVNEAGNGLSNRYGTIAMARTGVVNSATSQFFINTRDNLGLDHVDNTTRGFGYAVFGHVVEGLDAVTAIEHVPTHSVGSFDDVPVDDVVILEAREVFVCPGDCDGDGAITVADLLTLLHDDLSASMSCRSGDRDYDGTISVDELIRATQSPCP